MRASLMRTFAVLLALAATPAHGQTTAPATAPTVGPTTGPASRPTYATKQLYFDVSFFLPTWRARLPPGFLPAMSEGGGRFINAQGKEDSYFVGGYNGPRQEIIPAKLRAAVAPLPPGTLYVYDQEHPSWSTDVRHVAPDFAERNKRRYRAFADEIREGNPHVRVAFYALLPYSDYWMVMRQHNARTTFDRWRAGGKLTDEDRWTISRAYAWDGAAWRLNDAVDGGEGRAAFLKWQAAGDHDLYGTRDDGSRDDAAGLDDAVDAITPSLYDFYVGDDSEGYVAEMIAESRRLSGGRPVYPYVWPSYHDSNPTHGGKTIPIDEWRLHVARVLRQADGCVLWNADPVRHREHIRVLLEEAEKASRGK